MKGKIILLGFLVLGLIVSGCGGGGGGSFSATVAVQLTKDATPTTPYAVSQMTVTIRKSGSATDITGVTNASGIASIHVTSTGTYQLISVAGVSVIGSIEGSEGREFVKAAPIETAMPLLTDTPNSPISVDVTVSGTVNVNCPVPDIRRVTLIKKENSTFTDNITYALTESTDFTGRVILTNIQIANSGDRIIIRSDLNNNMNLYVNVASNFIYAQLYPNGLGNIAESITAWPFSGSIVFEVPSTDDWALTNASTTFRRNNNGSYVFGIFYHLTCLSVYDNGSGDHNPAGTLNYEIQRFETL